MPAAPPIAIERLVKIYKTVPAVDGISFTLEARLDHRAPWRQRRRQDHDHRHHHGAGDADLGPRDGARRRDAAAALPRAPAHEFRKPLCGSADAADRAAELESVRHALRRRRLEGAHRPAGARAQSDRSARPPDRPALGGSKNAGLARQGADQQSGRALARRADGFARSRYSRLGARPSATLLPASATPPCCLPRTT